MDRQDTGERRRHGAVPEQRGGPEGPPGRALHVPEQQGPRPAQGPPPGAIPEQHGPQQHVPQQYGHQHHGPPRYGTGPAGPSGYGPPPAGPHRYGPPPVQAHAPHLPPPPRHRPAWILPTVLTGVVLLAGSALAGITSTALEATSALTAATGTLGDAAYLTAVQHRPSFSAYTPSELVDLGHQVCTSLESGTSRSSLVGSAVSAGVGARDALALIDAATDSYCPDFSRR
ncbi:MAG: DUF732 domain-containing protein [Pseudonocardia sp.]|nr:DUF732 domain-containing protein [Pseudonocardia sp.]